MPNSGRRRPTRSVAAIVARVIAYLIIAWGTIIALAAGAVAGGGWIGLAVAAYTTIPLAIFLRWRGWPFYPGAAFRLFVVRPFWYTQLLLPLVAGGGLLGMVVGLPFGHALLIGRALAAVVAAIVGVVLVAGYLGSRRLVVRHVDVDVPDLPPSFDGFRIAQLSDLHIGPHTSRRFIERVVDATRSLAPDLVAVTGDLIDDRAEDVAVYARTIGALEAPLGVYMIPGNHDVYAGWDDVEHALRAAKLGTVLVNEARVIRRGDGTGDTITLVGTGDPAGGYRGAARAAPDIERAMAHVPDDATVIAFAHNPALWPALAQRGVALTLSGHTHWGQFALPHLGWSLASPFLEHAMGAHRDNDSVLYISPGTGYWGIPFRLGANPEVTLVTLHRAETAGAQVHRARAA
jgi:predicted MPP superfamily phosphohydrolase